MKHYKFRGKTVDTNEWVCGNLLSYDDEQLYLIEFKYENMYLKKQVLKETIGQFTGLFDRNGIEIYEDDLLKSFEENGNDFYLYGDTTHVEFLNGAYCISILYDMTPFPLYDYNFVYDSNIHYPDKTYLCNWLSDFEVVGNLIDNKNFKKNSQGV